MHHTSQTPYGKSVQKSASKDTCLENCHFVTEKKQEEEEEEEGEGEETFPHLGQNTFCTMHI